MESKYWVELVDISKTSEFQSIRHSQPLVPTQLGTVSCTPPLIAVHSTHSHRINQPPQTLDALGESLELWEKLNGEKRTIEAKFEPLSEQFAILEKYEVPIPENVSCTSSCSSPCVCFNSPGRAHKHATR